MSRNRQVLRIFGLTILLTIGFATFARLASWHAELAETSFHHNIIHLQDFLYNAQPRAVLVGSSLSGRVLASYFDGTPIAPVANLGLDSSEPVFGLDIVLKRPPPLIMIEVNLLHQEWNHNDDMMVDAMHGVRFQLAKYLPAIRADARPSSMLYTWAKLRNTKTNNNFQIKAAMRAQFHLPAASSSGHSGTMGSPALQEKLHAQIKALKERGCRIILVRLPSSQPHSADDEKHLIFGDELRREFNLPLFDLGSECARRGCAMAFTDGYHLAPASAREVAQIMADLVARGHTIALEPSP